MTAGGYNLFGVDDGGCNHGPTDRAGTLDAPLAAQLSPLGDHGGLVPTHLPLPDSPAIDFAPSCGGYDERGAPRPVDGDGDGEARCDAGAVEVSKVCLSGPSILCLQEGRFRVTATWRTSADQGTGQAVPLGVDTGSFWFFGPDNLELTVKVLNGCQLSQPRFWVFMAGLTDVETEISVEDTATGQTRTYGHPSGQPLQPRLDTAAFATCP